MSEPRYVRFFDEIGIDDVPLVGGKNASLGEMYRKLSGASRSAWGAAPAAARRDTVAA